MTVAIRRRPEPVPVGLLLVAIGVVLAVIVGEPWWHERQADPAT